MEIKKLFWVAGVLAIVLLAVGTYGTTTVLANGNNPPHPLGQRGHGGHGDRSLDSASLAAVAGVLNMSTDDLSAALQNGQTLQELADAADVDMQAVKDALNSVRQAELRDRINQAVTDGTITQDKANWFLEGLDKGYLDGPGFGFGFDLGGHSWKGTPLQQPPRLLTALEIIETLVYTGQYFTKKRSGHTPAPLLDSIVTDRRYKSLGGTRCCHPGAEDARNDGNQHDDPSP